MVCTSSSTLLQYHWYTTTCARMHLCRCRNTLPLLHVCMYGGVYTLYVVQQRTHARVQVLMYACIQGCVPVVYYYSVLLQYHYYTTTCARMHLCRCRNTLPLLHVCMYGGVYTLYVVQQRTHASTYVCIHRVCTSSSTPTTTVRYTSTNMHMCMYASVCTLLLYMHTCKY